MLPKERPILFSGPMVRAILAGHKTQTRRVVTRANSLVDGTSRSRALWESLDLSRAWVDAGPSPAGNAGPYLKAPHVPNDQFHGDDCVHRIYPQWCPGDRLWVQETFFCNDFTAGGFGGARAMARPHASAQRIQEWRDALVFRADGEFSDHYEIVEEGAGWTPSLYMPRWASRLTLEVTEVRVQRLQDISTHDIGAEGISLDNNVVGARNEFMALWNSINAKRGHSWESAPWVWAITYGVVEHNRAKTLGVGKSEAFMRSLGSGRLNEGSTRGTRHRFTKGHATWNKGHSYTAGGRSALTRFAKGMRPHNAVDVGTRLRDSEGYWKEKVGEPRRWQYCHRAAWEAVHGPVPRGMALLFRDGNKDHWQIENLQLVPRRDLMARNSVHNLPKPLAELVQLRGAVVRKINRLTRATTHAQQD